MSKHCATIAPALLRRTSALAASVATLHGSAASAEERIPLSYLSAAGRQAATILPHTWGFLGISIAVVVIISVLVLIGTLKRRPRVEPEGGGRMPVIDTLAGASWISIGVGATVVVLSGSVVWAAVVLADISAPPSEPRITIEIEGYRWWWKATYLGDSPERTFTTANEIHIPVGEPVKLELVSDNVIHSFWVPALGGKIDLIPGRTNHSWLQADEPGVYRGQCQEYCGAQHTLMGLVVVAEHPGDFQKWWDRQLEGAPQPTGGEAETGFREFIAHCAPCHTVRGTSAHGIVGPDLTHLMSRETLAAVTLRNTRANLAAWISAPQSIKPQSLMPNLELSGTELNQIRAYLETLR